MNSTTTVEDLKSQLNIVDVIGRVVPLKRSGANYKGVCPFHNEKTPSFVVSEQKQIFTCFGCGASGNVIEFTKRYYNLEFREACEKLGKEYGIEVAFGNSRVNREKEKLYEINREAAHFFYRAFSESANPAYSYMKRRGLDDRILKKFGIGYADREWDSLYLYLKEKGYGEKQLMDLGLISYSQKTNQYHDYFRNRVIFPIINTSGKVIGFGGRRIDENDNPKYLNSPENSIFSKKNNLYALNTTKQDIGKERSAILVEGYMDVISLYQHGVRNVSASLGTALTENQAKLLRRYTENVTLCYDADGAGQKAALRGIDILKPAGLNVKVFHVSDGKDPDEYAKAHGREAFLKLAASAVPATQYKLDSLMAGIDMNTDDGKLEYVKKAASVLKRLSPVEADIAIRSLAKSIRVSENAIRREIDGTKQEITPGRTEPEIRKQSAPEISGLEAAVLKALLTNPDLSEEMFEHPDLVSGALARKVLNFMFELYGTAGRFDLDEINDRLEPEESLTLDAALRAVIIAGKEEDVLRECIRKDKFDKLRARQKELIELLSLSDESESGQGTALAEELMKIQSEIDQNRGE